MSRGVPFARRGSFADPIYGDTALEIGGSGFDYARILFEGMVIYMAFLIAVSGRRLPDVQLSGKA